MDENKVHDQAETAVKKAESGDKTGLTEQLNSMSPAERVAIAKEMVKINERDRQTNDSLPIIEISTDFDASGQQVLVDVKTREDREWYNPLGWGDSGTAVYEAWFDKLPGGFTAYAELDPRTGRPTSEEVKRTDGYADRIVLDPRSGKPISEDFKFANGSEKHVVFGPGTPERISEEVKGTSEEIKWSFGGGLRNQYDPTTGQITSQEYKNSDGSTEKTVQFQYDSVTGKRISEIEKLPDGSTRRALYIQYDSVTGQRISELEKLADGSTERTIYNRNGNPESRETRDAAGGVATTYYDPNYPDGQKRTTTEEKRPDGSTENVYYDPITGKVKSVVQRGADHVLRRVEFDPASGNIGSIHEINADASAVHTVFDPVSGDVKSRDEIKVDGSKEHFEHDPVTGKRKPPTDGKASGYSKGKN